MLGFMHLSSFRLRLSHFFGFHQDSRPSYSFGERLWQNRHKVRLLHLQEDVGALPSRHRDIPWFEDINGHALDPNDPTIVVRKRAEDNTDIIVDDLSATLEAHRAANRARIIRKISCGHIPHSLSPYRPRMILSKEKTEDKKDFDEPSPILESHRAAARTEIHRIVPYPRSKEKAEDKKDFVDQSPILESHRAAARTMIHRKVLCRPCPNYFERRRFREIRNVSLISDYEGVAKKPYERWKSRPSEGREISPWLHLVTGTEGDGLARYLRPLV